MSGHPVMHIDKQVHVDYHDHRMNSKMNLFRIKRSFSGRVWALLTSLALLLLASACQPSIQLLAPITTVAPVAPAPRAVGIVGVDFDPPLAELQFDSGGGLRLLVAIENRGQQQELEVAVTARLFDATDGADAGSLADEAIVISALDPGEIRRVSFSQVTRLPVRGKYSLVVEVPAIPDELELWDNRHTYEIIVNGIE